MLKRLKSFFCSHFALRVVVLHRDPFRLTIDEWKGSLDLAKAAERALANPDVRLMLDALRNSHLSRFAAVGTIEQRALHLSRCEGYGACLNDFEAMSIFQPAKEDLEATFAPPEDTDLE